MSKEGQRILDDIDIPSSTVAIGDIDQSSLHNNNNNHSFEVDATQKPKKTRFDHKERNAEEEEMIDVSRTSESP